MEVMKMIIVFRKNGFIGGYNEKDGEYIQCFNTTLGVLPYSLKAQLHAGQNDNIKIFIEDDEHKFNSGLPSIEEYLNNIK
jgi:hypothetical protein